jgi:hypothetical protein
MKCAPNAPILVAVLKRSPPEENLPASARSSGGPRSKIHCRNPRRFSSRFVGLRPIEPAEERRYLRSNPLRRFMKGKYSHPNETVPHQLDPSRFGLSGTCSTSCETNGPVRKQHNTTLTAPPQRREEPRRNYAELAARVFFGVGAVVAFGGELKPWAERASLAPGRQDAQRDSIDARQLMHAAHGFFVSPPLDRRSVQIRPPGR